MNNELIERAIYFARNKHCGQVRKWSNEPYVCHPLAMYDELTSYLKKKALMAHLNEDYLTDLACACILHDTIEDTDTTFEEIKQVFNDNIAGIVRDVTNKTTLEDGNRETRKKIENTCIANLSFKSKIVKLLDVKCNLNGCVNSEFKSTGKTRFTEKYLQEKEHLLNEMEKHDAYQDRANPYFQLYRKIFEDTKDVLNNEKLTLRDIDHDEKRYLQVKLEEAENIIWLLKSNVDHIQNKNIEQQKIYQNVILENAYTLCQCYIEKHNPKKKENEPLR